jgi:hypothetical protein
MNIPYFDDSYQIHIPEDRLPVSQRTPWEQSVADKWHQQNPV